MNNIITHEIPEGYKARIEGNKVIIERELSPLEVQIKKWFSEDNRLPQGDWMNKGIRERANIILQIIKEGGQELSAPKKLPKWENADKFPKGEDLFIIDQDYLYCRLTGKRIQLSTLLNLPNDDNN